MKMVNHLIIIFVLRAENLPQKFGGHMVKTFQSLHPTFGRVTGSFNNLNNTHQFLHYCLVPILRKLNNS